MADYRAMRDAAHASHQDRQRRFGGGISGENSVARGVHKHERALHPGEKETKLASGGAVEGRASGGRRLDRKGKKHGTTVNIIVGGGKEDEQATQQAHQAGMQQGVQLGAKLVAAKLAGAGGGPGGPPPGMVPGGGGMPPPAGGLPPGVGGPPPPGGPPPMMRKRGGRALGELMTAGAGSGEGRLEETALAEREMRS